MTTLTLTKLAEIEAAFDDQNSYLHHCDPATVAALVRIARAAVDLLADGEAPFSDLDNAVRAAGLIE